jgi:hypothetical protein
LSDDDEREHGRRRHSSGGGVGRWVTIAGWVIAAGLAANLVIGQLRKDDVGRPEGVISKDLALGAAFWLAVAVTVGAAALGIHWTMKTHARREKSSLLWMRNSFIFCVVSAVLLAAVPRDKGGYWYIAWLAAAIVAAQTSLFAYTAFREFRRTVGQGGGRRGGSSSSGSSGEGD